MKKIITIVVAALFMTGIARGDISVALNVLSGVFLNHGGTSLNDMWGGGGLMQLIWSTVPEYSPSTTPVGGQPGVIANYWVLWSGTIGPPEEWANDHDGGVNYSNADVGGNNINAGYIYARVFEIASPVIGTWYASSLIYSTANFGQATNIPPPVPDAVDMTDGTDSWYDTDLGFRLQPLDHGQVVPEPSTLALALAGVGLLVYRRLRK